MSIIEFPVSGGSLVRSNSSGPIFAEDSCAWEKYLAARDRAEKSRNISDGIAAGKAWKEWLDLFAPGKGVRP